MIVFITCHTSSYQLMTTLLLVVDQISASPFNCFTWENHPFCAVLNTMNIHKLYVMVLIRFFSEFIDQHIS